MVETRRSKRQRTNGGRVSQAALAQRVVGDAAHAALTRRAFAATALESSRRKQVKGLGGARRLPGTAYVLNADGKPVDDPITMDPIPLRRAVKVGRHWHNAESLRKLFRHTPDARHPLTREPFPDHIRQRYGPRAAAQVVAELAHVLETLHRAESMRAAGAPSRRIEQMLRAARFEIDHWDDDEIYAMYDVNGPVTTMFVKYDVHYGSAEFLTQHDGNSEFDVPVGRWFSTLTVFSRAPRFWAAALREASQQQQHGSVRRLSF